MKVHKVKYYERPQRVPIGETVPQNWQYPLSNLDLKKYDYDNLGFIMLRCVRSTEDNELWQESYRCIRRFYPNRLMIIDDRSNPEFLSTSLELVNCTVIETEFSGGQAELLPYYYFDKMKPFKRAVILQDATFIRAFIDWNKYRDQPVVNVWNFHISENNITNSLIQHLDNSDTISNWFRDTSIWRGCFGLMTIMDLEFLDLLQARTNFLSLVKVVTKREQRYELEKLFGCICTWLYPELYKNKSILGNILTQFGKGQTFEKYKQGYYSDKIVKVWCGR